MFRGYNKWRKMSSLRDTLISGFEPQVSNRSFGAIFDHANRLFQKMKNCLLLNLRSCGRFRNLTSGGILEPASGFYFKTSLILI